MSITPQPAPDERPRRVRYDWSKIVPGVWQTWLDTRAETLTDDEAKQRADRVRLAAYAHARNHRMTLESRTVDHGRVLDLKFHVV